MLGPDDALRREKSPPDELGPDIDVVEEVAGPSGGVSRELASLYANEYAGGDVRAGRADTRPLDGRPGNVSGGASRKLSTGPPEMGRWGGKCAVEDEEAFGVVWPSARSSAPSPKWSTAGETTEGEGGTASSLGGGSWERSEGGLIGIGSHVA